MRNVLLITSSPRGEASYSTQVATDLAREIGGDLTIRELWREPLAPIDQAILHAFFTADADRTPEQRAALALSDTFISELQSADTVVIAAGMINFGMPASLKTWVDLVTRGGVTFRYGESGPEGLLTGKRVILVLAAGGVYSTGPMSAMDHLEPALRTNLSFLGMTEIETVWVEGTALGPSAAEEALEKARTQGRELAASVR